MSTVKYTIDGFLKWGIVDIRTDTPTVVATYWSQQLAESTRNMSSDPVVKAYRQNHPNAQFVVTQVLVKYSEQSFTPPGYGGSGNNPVAPPTSAGVNPTFSDMARKYQEQFGSAKLSSHQSIIIGQPKQPPEQPAPVPVTKKEEQPNG